MLSSKVCAKLRFEGITKSLLFGGSSISDFDLKSYDILLIVLMAGHIYTKYT